MLTPLNPPRECRPPGPPPQMVEGEGGLFATDYFHTRWREENLHFLSCHRGVMRLFGPQTPELLKMRNCEIVLCTRGLWHSINPNPKRERKWQEPPPREMLELYFPAVSGESWVIYLDACQVNRLPGWQPGKRCWRLQLFRENLCQLEVAREWPVYFRTLELPCLKPWEGEAQGR